MPTRKSAPARPAPPPPGPGTPGYVQPSRLGKKSLVGYFDREAHKAVKQLALDLDRNVEDLMREAFQDLLTKYGLAEKAKAFSL